MILTLTTWYKKSVKYPGQKMQARGASPPGLYGIFRYEPNLRPPYIAELDLTSGLSSGRGSPNFSEK